MDQVSEEKVGVKGRALSTDTAEMTDDEDEALSSVNPGIKTISTDIIAKYYDNVFRLIHAIRREPAVYHFVPQLVASNVTTEILQQLQTLVKGYHVKCQVVDAQLFILELSTGREHGAGVANIVEQIGLWRSGQSADDFVSSTTDADYPNGNNNAAPDLVLAAGVNYRNVNQPAKIGKCLAFSACQMSSVF